MRPPTPQSGTPLGPDLTFINDHESIFFSGTGCDILFWHCAEIFFSGTGSDILFLALAAIFFSGTGSDILFSQQVVVFHIR